jgi:hypothetical protein
LLVCAPAQALKDHAEAKWNDDFSELEVDFGGVKATFPDAMSEGSYPAPGAPIQVTVSSVWPVVYVHGRFVCDMSTCPPEYRPTALDLVTMYSGDANHYQQTFGKYVLKAEYERPPEFLKEAENPLEFKLVEALRGKPVTYKSTSSAGFGAADYTVVNVSTLGLSDDKRTVISFGDPEKITDHLRDRKLVIGILDDGNNLYFDIRAICLCKDRWLFRDEMLRRIGETMNYVGDRLYSDFHVAPTKEQIEAYLEQARTTNVSAN